MALKELNLSCTVDVDNSPITAEIIKAHKVRYFGSVANRKVVVFTEPRDKSEAIRINNLCRENSTPDRTICNIIAGNFGVFGLSNADFAI